MTEPSGSSIDQSEAPKKGGLALRVKRARAEHRWFDHLARAGVRYQDRQGDYLAAAVTYFSFLAIFPLLLVATAVLGLFLKYDPGLLDQLSEGISANVPSGVAGLLNDALSTAQDSAAGIGIVSLVFFLYSGLGWISNLRIGVRQMWGLPAEEPALVKDTLVNLFTLGGLGITILVSVALSAVSGALTGFIVDLLGLGDIPGATLITGAVALAAALLADVLIFVYIMAVLPRHTVAMKSVIRGAILGMVGFEIIKIVATIYIDRLTSSPAYAVFGSILGLLFFINLVMRLVMFVVSWTSTSPAQELSEIAGTAAASCPVPDYLLAPAPVRRSAVAPGAILAVLLAVGAAVGAMIPGFFRRWWRGPHR